ncbi:hypothetical protein FBU59_004218 [Linderina macrospora]|uniref:Uncharacterized protein n=1 Tax=Linderina macrospora TaxID=4868 RepID=A0ACC1J622_9FUNG|nr:hypothetical protein FBU59_004218 [Linderina macrospora]
MLAEHSFGSLVFEGKNTTSERDILLESFASDVSCNVLLVSKKAGGTGLNLIAANHVIIESLWWNPAVDAQAVDRVYRIGQKKNVHVHRLVASDTIDEAMYIIQGRKADMIEVVLGKRDVAKNKKLNRADVISLINNI